MGVGKLKSEHTPCLFSCLKLPLLVSGQAVIYGVLPLLQFQLLMDRTWFPSFVLGPANEHDEFMSASMVGAPFSSPPWSSLQVEYE